MGIEAAKGCAVPSATGRSRPVKATWRAASDAPAAASRSASRTPVQTALPIAPAPHGTPAGAGGREGGLRAAVVQVLLEDPRERGLVALVPGADRRVDLGDFGAEAADLLRARGRRARNARELGELLVLEGLRHHPEGVEPGHRHGCGELALRLRRVDDADAVRLV